MATSENLHTYLKYITDGWVADGDAFLVEWDWKNDELNELMTNEMYYTPKDYGDRANFMWLEEVKKHYNYKLGEKMYIFLKHNVDGSFLLWKHNKDECYDMYIDEEGYVNFIHYYYPFTTYNMKSKNGYSDGIEKMFIKPDCVYNDNIYKNLKK
jgi:hypothetical protein